MKSRTLAAFPLVAVSLLVAACGNSPTESSAVPTTGSLVITLAQPCALPGSVTVLAGTTPLGTLVSPGSNTFSLPAGSYSLAFVRGQQTFGASGQVQVPAGGSVVLTDPPAACMSTAGTH